ncbi:T9SS type A sorting domain-containing protein [Ekhidna sp. To15]|uniref:T9SS type A sorting domain-containing protein n=1 Tax=Ekhidna sp. To15 TaxID=3395267 RepID=UPI003F526C91
MKFASRISMVVAVLAMTINLNAQTTYYSFATGDWEAAASWTLTSDGSSGASATAPGGTDNVVIRSGHTITIDDTDDNGNETTADALGLANVGAFTGSNANAFYHEGDIIVANGGILTATVRVMTADVFDVDDGGDFSTTNDLIILGSLDISSTASFDVGDDFILSGNSRTIIDNTSTAGDDLYIDHTNATLCGDGTIDTGNGGGDPTVQYLNSATAAQVCSSFNITCTTNCGGFTSGPPSGGFITGITGPGGVGDASNNQLWLRADDLSLSDGASVSSWSDASGNSLTANSSGVSAEEPTFNTNDVNGFPSISFDGGDFLNLGNVAALNLTPGTDSWSFFIVYNVAGATPQGTFFSKATNANRHYQYTIDDNAGTSRFTAFIGGNATTGSVTATNDWFVSSSTNDATQKDSWTDESSNFAAAGVGTTTEATADVLIGARRDTGPTTGTGFLLTGSIAEIAMFDAEVNAAQRIITTNYLAAKYDITLNANDVYDMDDNGNGDFDYEAAGIGQAADGSNHTDARGSGVVRMWDPSDLDNSEFIMWGHDNTVISTKNAVDVDGTVIEERLDRIWRLSETGDLGTVSISFDFSTVGNSLGSNLRLLIDRDGDGFDDNDVTPIAGSVAGDVATFSNIDFQDGDRFTIGNTDVTLPLPVELISFEATALDDMVRLDWATATEINNDFFSVERSGNGEDWVTIASVKGNGNSNQARDYHAIDRKPVQGLSYYRLKQTDYDGEYSHSEIRTVDLSSSLEVLFATPNPSDGLFTINRKVIDDANVRVFDRQGKQIDNYGISRQSKLVLDLSGFSAGVYFLNISNEIRSETIRLVKE